MRYKSLILLIVFATYCILTYAQEVDYGIAKNIAASFISIKKGNNQESSFVVTNEYTISSSQGEALVYIFNFEGGGFVIVAADKRAEPILAYSATNSFLMGGVNPAAESWVNNTYAEGISYAKEMKMEAAQDLKNRWDDAEKGFFFTKMQKTVFVEPLLTSKWNQDKYYNALCPDTIQSPSMVSYDDHTPNGCVAVAMAQIMYYHRYPRNGVGTTIYTCPGYGQLKADYANANYNYEAMSDEATGYSNAIAQLCYHAGVSVKMKYEANGSGTSEDEADAFYRRFQYKNPTKIDRQNVNNIAVWRGYLMSELNKRLPVYYSACNGTSATHGCHAFVCDGYEINGNDTLFHFNWGWGGSNDAFYTLNTMLNYTLANTIIIGIEPSTTPIKSTGADTLTATYGSFSDGSSPKANYAKNTNRSWLITPQNAANITLKTSYFSTGSDIVTIYNGNGSVVATLSGNIDTIIRVESSKAFVTFIGNTPARGFLFTYTCNRISSNLCPRSVLPNAALTSDVGTISDNDINNYDDENECYWALKPTGAKNIGITFTKFDLAEGDFVELNKWNGTSFFSSVKYFTHKVGRFTKDNSPTLDSLYIVPDQGAFIRFRTDNNLNDKGFTLNWIAIPDPGVKEAHAGIEKMSVYPNPATDKVKIQIETLQPETVQIAVYDVVGRVVSAISTWEATQHITHDIDVSSFAKGIYMLRVTTSKGQVMRKVVIQ